jgi:hypothetical protein
MKKLKVSFYLKGDKKNQNGETAIYAKIYLGSLYSTFSTSKYILQERWSKTNNLRNVVRIDNEINLKNYLKSLVDGIESKYNELIRNNPDNEEITPLYLKNYCFNEKTEHKITLLEIIEKHNEYFKKQVTKGDRAKGSLEKYERMANVIKDFLQSKHKIKDIQFEKVNRQFVYALDEFLRFERIHGKNKGLGNNTTVKYLRNISSMINYTWWLGSEAGNAIADVLFGDYNPSGKLPMTFPRDEGQIPIYYNHLNTGRPAHNEPVTSYASGYTDIKNSPIYSFGHGLSYTTFNYSDLKISNQKMKMNQEIIVTLKVTNSGKVAGEEVVQLYLRDKVASVVRPILELKDFQKIKLNIGETKTVTFTIDNQKLSFYNQKLDYISEPGNFDLMIGSSSTDIRLKDNFELIK